MAYTPHTLVAFGGSWTGAATEQWECTVRLSNDGGGGVTLDQTAYMNDIFAALSTYFSTIANGMRGDASLTYLKVNGIGADGKYASPALTNVHSYVPVLGGAAGVGSGIQSYCFSWHTAIVRGPAHHGRIYPPNSTRVMDSPFTMSPANAALVATSGKNLLTVLRNVGAPAGRQGTPIVASKIGGAVQTITGVSCRS